MFIRTTTGRNKDGSTRIYLHLVQGYRVNGKVKQKVVANLGRLDILQVGGGLDRVIASLARYSERCWLEAEGEAQLVWAKCYGPVLIFRRLWEHLGLANQVGQLPAGSRVDFPVEEAVFAMVLHRLLDPGSKRATHRWLKTVYRPEFESLELHHLYRALDYLVQKKEKIEEALFARNRDLFCPNFDLMLFDTTSVYFEGQGPEGVAEYGYSREHRPDRVQVVLGLLMSRDGIPVAHHVFPGNTADIKAFRHAIADLRRRFPLRRVVIIADRGVVAEPLLEELELEGMEYIVGMPLRKWKEVREIVLSRAGRYHEVKDNLKVKEVEAGGHRYIVCHNPEGEERDRKERESIVAMLAEYLSQGGLSGLVKRKGWGRYLRVKEAGKVEIDHKKIAEEARYDGKYVLRTNTSLVAAEIALDYKSLWQVEHAFRELKSGLEVRPVYLRTEAHVRGHIVVCFLALVLEATLGRLLKRQGTQASYREIMADLFELMAVRFEARGKAWLWRTELQGLAYEAFRAIGVRPPARVQLITQV